jgi:cytochrome b6-f complex iron-sulfur subunit
MRDAAGRRNVLNWFLSTTVGAFVLSVVYPVSRYLIPPDIPESATAGVTLPFTTNDVKINSGRLFKFGSRPGLLVRTESGEFRAFLAICTHLNCTVQYRDDIGHIWCACHNGHYDLNGRNIAGPPPRPLETLVVNVQGNQITVRKAST